MLIGTITGRGNQHEPGMVEPVLEFLELFIDRGQNALDAVTEWAGDVTFRRTKNSYFLGTVSSRDKGLRGGKSERHDSEHTRNSYGNARAKEFPGQMA